MFVASTGDNHIFSQNRYGRARSFCYLAFDFPLFVSGSMASHSLCHCRNKVLCILLFPSLNATSVKFCTSVFICMRGFLSGLLVHYPMYRQETELAWIRCLYLFVLRVFEYFVQIRFLEKGLLSAVNAVHESLFTICFEYKEFKKIITSFIAYFSAVNKLMYAGSLNSFLNWFPIMTNQVSRTGTNGVSVDFGVIMKFFLIDVLEVGWNNWLSNVWFIELMELWV